MSESRRDRALLIAIAVIGVLCCPLLIGAAVLVHRGHGHTVLVVTATAVIAAAVLAGAARVRRHSHRAT